MIIGLTPMRDGTGQARLPDRIEGRSTQVFKSWLGGRPKVWTEGVEVVAMDGFTGFQAAAAKELPRSRLWIRFMSSGLPAMPWTAAVSAFDGRPSGTTDGPGTGSTPPGGTQGKQLSCKLWSRDQCRRCRRAERGHDARPDAETPCRRRARILDRPGTSNGLNAALNGRLEHLPRSALGFRNLANSTARSLLEAGGFRPPLDPQLRSAP